MSDFDLVGAMEAAGIDEYRINYRTRVVRLSDKGIRLWYTQLFGRAPRVDVSVLSYQGWIFRSRGRKLYLCERCGTEMVYIDPDQGYRCPRGHGGGEWPRGVEKVIRQPGDAVYGAGAMVPKSESKGRKRKAPTKGTKSISKIYLDPYL